MQIRRERMNLMGMMEAFYMLRIEIEVSSRVQMCRTINATVSVSQSQMLCSLTDALQDISQRFDNSRILSRNAHYQDARQHALALSG